MLEERRLRDILREYRNLHWGIVGDFFLDAYFDCDPRLDEKSLETGKTCYQVVRTRRQAGAAGTVAANLKALGIGRVEAVGFCGDDGEGYELRRAMDRLGLELEGFLRCPDRFTPTYGKPCYLNPDRRDGTPIIELERLDMKNRNPTPVGLQEDMIAYIRSRLDSWDGLILVDQANESNCGVLTSRVRRFLIAEARRRSDMVFLADSRERIHLFKHMMIKPNQFEAAVAVTGKKRKPSLKIAAEHARILASATRRPVFLTLSEKGMLVADGQRVDRIKAVPVAGPIDPVGAGDSTSAAIAASLGAGASYLEAATIASLVAAITVQQLGTTGTARPAQIRQCYREVSGHGL